MLMDNAEKVAYLSQRDVVTQLMLVHRIEVSHVQLKPECATYCHLFIGKAKVSDNAMSSDGVRLVTL